MRFRPPLKSTWFYPFCLCGLAALAYGVFRLKLIGAVPAGLPRRDAPALFLALLALGAGYCIVASWKAWTARVDVDDAGVRWKYGANSGFKRWDEISSLSLHGVDIALVDRGSGMRFPLPMVSRELYEALKARLKPLSSEDEKVLFPEA
jgi:hypothetical protein